MIVPVPETEPAVESFRAELDRAATWGIPAHVTVLYPFLPPDRIGSRELRRLSEAVRMVPCFDVAFGRVEWFGRDVVWLAPEPGDGFRALTAAVWSAFPDCPPYSGLAKCRSTAPRPGPQSPLLDLGLALPAQWPSRWLNPPSQRGTQDRDRFR